MVGVSASVNLPLHHKVQKFSSGTGSPGWPRKVGRETVVVQWWCVVVRVTRVIADVSEMSDEVTAVNHTETLDRDVIDDVSHTETLVRDVTDDVSHTETLDRDVTDDVLTVDDARLADSLGSASAAEHQQALDGSTHIDAGQ